MPALANSFLLYQKPTMPLSHEMPYSFPSSVYGFSATGWRPPTHDLVASVRSCTRPASACCLSTPPPHDWNRSGALPDWVVVVSLALNASFSIGVILMVTLGCCAMYALAIWSQTGCSGG